jgi:hypothetical protein
MDRQIYKTTTIPIDKVEGVFNKMIKKFCKKNSYDLDNVVVMTNDDISSIVQKNSDTGCSKKKSYSLQMFRAALIFTCIVVLFVILGYTNYKQILT